MFDIGFWELAIISIVALLIVGPEKLPELVRDAGRWVRAIRRFVTQTKRDLQREFDFEEEKNLFGSLRDMDNLLENAPDRKQRKQDTGGDQSASDGLYPEEDEYYASVGKSAADESSSSDQVIDPIPDDSPGPDQAQHDENQEQEGHPDTASSRKPVDEDITS